MKILKGTFTLSSGQDVESYVKIVALDASSTQAELGVHRFYYKDAQKIYLPINGTLTKRYVFDWDIESIDNFITQGYTFLLTLPDFIGYTLVEILDP